MIKRILLVLTLGLMPAAVTYADEAAIEAMQEYMEFSTYEAGIILPQQLTEDVFNQIVFIDTRDATQFSNSTIKGAINIEWREVLGRMDEIPTEGKVVLFCNTGTLSSQAAFALRVAGLENVSVLQTGLIGWQQTAAYLP